MELLLTRDLKKCAGKKYTEGRLSVNGTYLCDTLEPQWRDIGWGRPGKKVNRRRAIPAGRYAVVMTKFAQVWPLAAPAAGIAADLPGIRMHEGNTVEYGSGILLGKKIHEGHAV